MHLTTLLTAVASASMVSAQLAEELQTTSWTITKLTFSINNVASTASYSFTVDAPLDGFNLDCAGYSVPWADTTYRDCAITKGGEKLGSAQAYLELRPGKPIEQTKLSISVGIEEQPGNTKTIQYHKAEKAATFNEWQALKGQLFYVNPSVSAVA